MPAALAPTALRSFCSGTPPLDARLADWMTDALADPATLPEGSPVNLHDTGPFGENIREMQQVADRHGIELEIFFARKANKALAYVAAARRLGIGVDTASEQELSQTLDAGLPAERVISTAVIKTPALMRQIVESGCIASIDNADELDLLTAHVPEGRTTPAMIRLSGFEHEGRKLPSRFGVDIDDAVVFVDRWPQAVSLVGVHVHLDGYDAQQRASAALACLPLIDRWREAGHPIRFVDLGGGVPMSYLQSREQWAAFQAAVADTPDRVTHDATAYRRGEAWSTYPYWQQPTRGEWLDGLLATIARPLRDRGLMLRLEPGRSLLDGCGLTVADVAFRKPLSAAATAGPPATAIGLAMNRTQCRTTSEDFLVDPLLLPTGSDRDGQPLEGFVVGAYCMESEYLTKRRLRFPHGVAVGDRVVFPNTAGYLMHFLESRSHQFPLAKNYERTEQGWSLDAIDR